MLLEARSKNCFSGDYVLKLDDRPVGHFRGRWFSEGIDIRLSEQLKLHFSSGSWMGRQFSLSNSNSGEVLTTAQKPGFFSRTWDLSLQTGPAQLVPKSFFSYAYDVVQNGENVARATRIGWCERGCFVEDNDTLDATDMIFVGLLYHTILQRQRRNNNSNT